MAESEDEIVPDENLPADEEGVSPEAAGDEEFVDNDLDIEKPKKEKKEECEP